MLTHTQLNIYTNGSKTTAGVGAGIIVYIFNKNFDDYFPLAPGATIFQTEQKAITYPVKFLTKHKNYKP